MEASPATGPHPVEAAIREVEQRFLLRVDGVAEVLLIRHADCYEGLRADRLPDPPLSALGRRQAAALARRLQGTAFAAVYASDLGRAQETARAFSPEVRTDPRLVEAAIDWEGGLHFQESIADVAARVGAAVDDAVAAHPGGRIAMVSHGGAIMAYLAQVLRLKEAPGLRLVPDFTSVSVVRALGERRVVGSIADATHLEGVP